MLILYVYYLISLPHAPIEQGPEVVAAGRQDDLVGRDPLPLHDERHIWVLWREAQGTDVLGQVTWCQIFENYFLSNWPTADRDRRRSAARGWWRPNAI